MIKPDDLVSRSDDLAFRVIQGEAIILTAKDRVIHTLNEVGTRIWELIDTGIKVGDLIAKICEEYEVDERQAERDVLEFLGELKEKGIIVIQGTGDEG